MQYIKSSRLGKGLTETEYVQELPAVKNLAKLEELPLPQPVIFFVGENGTGKSTLLEAIAVAYGFNPEGGTVNFNFSSKATHSQLHSCMTLVKGSKRPEMASFYGRRAFIMWLQRATV